MQNLKTLPPKKRVNFCCWGVCFLALSSALVKRFNFSHATDQEPVHARPFNWTIHDASC